MKTRSIIFYYSKSQLTRKHQPLVTSDGTIFLRAEASQSVSIDTIMKDAKRMRGESILNIIPNGQTFGEHAIPQINEMSTSARMPVLTLNFNNHPETPALGGEKGGR